MSDIVTLNGYKIKDEKAVRSYETVALMKADTKLKEGYHVKTKGYYEANDGGHGEYVIVDDETLVDDGGSIHVLSNGLRAKLIINDYVNVHQFGAYGDNSHDDTEAIRKAVNSGSPLITFGENKNYMITPFTQETNHGILVPSNTTINLNGSNIKVIENDKTHYKVFSFLDVNNSKLINGNITGDIDYHTGNTGEWGYGISIIHSENITLENLYISKCWGDGININFSNQEQFDSKNIFINNCICDNNRRQGMSIEAGKNIFINNCEFINTGQTSFTAPGSGVDIEPLVSGKTLNNIIFTNCLFKGNKGIQFVGTGGTNHPISNLTIDSCIIDDELTSYNWSLWLDGFKNLKILNSQIGKNDSHSNIILRPMNDIIFKNNDVSCNYINLRTSLSPNSLHRFENNNIKSPSDKKETIGLFNNYETNGITNQNVTVLFKNNKFIDKTSGEYVYSMILNLIQNQGIDKAIIENNYIQGGKTSIYTSCSSIIKNNVICGQTEYGISLLDSIVSGKQSYFDIENNNFQNCGSNTSIVWNYYKKNLVLRNNIYYPVYFNEGIGETNYPKTSFTTYTSGLTGYTLIEDNNIISLTE